MDRVGVAAGTERILTANFLAITTANFAGYGSIYLLFAVLPIYILRIGGNNSEVGLITGVFAGTALVVRPFVGRASDARGRKPLILVGAGVLTVSGLLYLVAKSVPSLLALRAFHGMGFAVFSTIAMALVADISPKTRRGEAIGYFGASVNMAMIAGPALGAFLMQHLGFTILFISSAGLALTAFIVSSTLSVTRAQLPGDRQIGAAGLIERSALFPSAVIGMMAITYASIVSFMPLLAESRHIGNAGLFFTTMGVVTLSARGPLGRLSDRYGRSVIIVSGLLFIAASLVALAYTSSLLYFLAVAFVYGLGFAAVQPCLMALTVDRSSPESRGAAMGTMSAGMDMGVVLGSFAMGFVAQSFGFTALYLAAASAALGGAVFFATNRKPGRSTRTA